MTEIQIDKFQDTLEICSAFNESILLHSNCQSQSSYNAVFKENGYGLTPAKWRMSLCEQVENLLQNNAVSMDLILSELQKCLNSESYGFNGDLVILLAKYDAPINSVIVFRGIHCTLLHAIVSLCGSFNLSKNNESFRQYLMRNKPLVDVKDAYGRTALVIAVWNLSQLAPNLNEVNTIRCLIEYGFSPFVRYRGIMIVDKLSKTCNMVKQSATANEQASDTQNVRNVSKAVQSLLATFGKIKYYRQRVEAIQSSLKILVDTGVIIDDVANEIQDFIGIHSKRSFKRIIPKRQSRIELIRRLTAE